MQDESYGLRSKNSWRKEWGTSPWLSDDSLFIYRCVSGLLWLAFTLYDLTIGDWTYLTTWVIFVTGLYFICACVTILMLRLVTTNNELPCVGKLAWILLNIVAGTSMTVTLGYWCLEHSDHVVDFRSYVRHGVGSVWIMLDIVLTYNPLYFKHVYQCTLFLLVYVMMTIIYDFMEKSEWYVYSYIDWSNDFVEALYMSFVFAFVIPPFLYFLQALIKPQLELDQIEQV